MISTITIILFFVYLWGLGFTALYWVQKPEHSWERQLLYFGVGLGIFPILAIILNFLHLPLDWRIFLALSLLLPIYSLVQKVRKKEFKKPSFKINLTKSNLILLGVIIIFMLSLLMYVKGAFSYPYLEDEDPWGHAVGAKYVALEKKAYDPSWSVENGQVDQVLSYIDPYPPAYDVLMGILHQTSPDLNWTLKFFNALIISLGLVFFYLFAQEFMQSKSKALLGTFFLAAIPSYLSHFIWAHSLAITLFFPAMYALLLIQKDTKWAYVSIVMVASIWVSQNLEEPIKLTAMMLIFVLVASITVRKFLKMELISIFSGILLSFLWWGAMIKKYTLRGVIQYYTGDRIVTDATVSADSGTAITSSGLSGKIGAAWHSLTSSGGSGSRAYSFNDFFYAQSNNAINGPIGIGIVFCLLVILALGYILLRYRKDIVTAPHTWMAVAVFWLIYSFWAVNGQTFPVSIARGPFRSWFFLAISVALIAIAGVEFLMALAKKVRIPQWAIIVMIIVGVFFTSAVQKYQLNTSVWPTSGSFTNPQEPFEYGAWFQSLPPNARVFIYAPRGKLAIGYGADSCEWCQDVVQFRGDLLHNSVPELHSFLKDHHYEYLLINPAMDFKYFSSQFGENETKKLLSQRYAEISNSGLFSLAYQKENQFVALKVI